MRFGVPGTPFPARPPVFRAGTGAWDAHAIPKGRMVRISNAGTAGVSATATGNDHHRPGWPDQAG